MADREGLFEIRGCRKPDRLLDVVFVHGLGGHPTKTWHPKGRPEDLWLRWLGKDLPRLAVWSLGYGARVSDWLGPSMPLADRTRNAMEHLRVHGLIHRPLVFVAHSLGGILVKRMLRHAADRRSGELAQVRGIAFLATPHSGSGLATFGRLLPRFLRPSTLVYELVAAHPELRDLSFWYRDNHRHLGVRNKVYYETRKTGLFKVVREDSADPGLPDVDTVALPDDHFSIAKPAGRESLVYRSVCSFLRECLAAPAPGPTPGARTRRGSPPSAAEPTPEAAEPLAHLPQRIAPTRLPRGARKLFGREEELGRLERAWEDPEIRLFTLVAWGGVGKSALMAAWQGEMARRDFDGADYFDWSFYSQGSREGGGGPGEIFIARALEFFGDPEMANSPASPWTKGARLAELVAARRTLLILDGLEPLQHPPGPQAGELQDPAVATLLKGLAAKNPGLCVITTREGVVDLAGYQETTAPEWELEGLSTPAGTALLKELGVRGADSEIEALVEEVQGHALTLHLLGRYLTKAHGGDVRRKDRVKLRKADAKTRNGHAFRAMAAYEKWLGGSGKGGRRQLAILRLMGLFDRPASAGCIEALRAEPLIEGLTEPLVGMDEEDWNEAVSDLEEVGLLAARDTTTDGSLDAHPLLREYFGEQLQQHSPAAWPEAHGRLFDHLKHSTEELPDTLEALQPLYQAVAHGCWAERQEEARAEVYRDRILRGTGNDGFYSTNKLGAFGADLGAVACFFDKPWSRLSPSLSEPAQAWLLNEAAFRLRALGRLREALEPMRAGLANYQRQKNWAHAAKVAGNLSELELTLGEVEAAEGDAEAAVGFADKSGDGFLRMVFRTTLADARHQAGRGEEALSLFREAEEMQAKRQPPYPLLYSLQGFRYCDLLLAGAEAAAWRGTLGPGTGSSQMEASRGGLLEACREVEQRAAKTLEWTQQNSAPLLDFALNFLTLGRAALYRALLEGSDPTAAGPEIEKAVDGLRRAGTQHMISLGLLTRAHLRAATGEEAGARADLAEAEEIATRGPMPLFLADVHLHRARLFRDREALAETRRLIDKHHYGRRQEELEDAETAAQRW